ncbi:hypothetical protein H8356DRAFT_1415825 [Neocallimastix lanati (nom. inval.)]|nr:hypothetical protein H8356DRAFT_1415825 [Neocallimastix sp. JGI-2020a]
MINCHTGTAKETPYRSTLRDPRGKAEPTIGAGHCKSSQTRLTQWDSYSVRNIENLENNSLATNLTFPIHKISRHWALLALSYCIFNTDTPYKIIVKTS